VFDGENFLPEYPDLCGKEKCYDDFIIKKYKQTNMTDPEKRWNDHILPVKTILYDGKIEAYPYKVRYSDESMKLVTIGRLKGYDGIEKLYMSVEKAFSGVPSRHYTYIFNIFVML